MPATHRPLRESSGSSAITTGTSTSLTHQLSATEMPYALTNLPTYSWPAASPHALSVAPASAPTASADRAARARSSATERTERTTKR